MTNNAEELRHAAKEVHSHLGEGYTETVYHSALSHELSEQGIAHHSESTIPVMYKGAAVGRRRPDMFVQFEDETIVVELKAGSSSGTDQAEQYVEILLEDDNYNTIVGAAVIRFNKEVEFGFSEVNEIKGDQQDLFTFEDE